MMRYVQSPCADAASHRRTWLARTIMENILLLDVMCDIPSTEKTDKAVIDEAVV
jgi:ATP-dependent protease Clp ATPase subunit